MKEFNLKINDLSPNMTPEQEKALILQTLSLFDGDWCHILTGLSRTFNQKSKPIQELQNKVQKLRNLVGSINNDRISRWQQEYFKYEATENDLKKGDTEDAVD